MPKIAGMNARIFVKGNGSYETLSLRVTAPATAAGNVTVTLGGAAVTVAVLLNDTISQVADKIRAGTFAGWTASGVPSSDTITFTATTIGTKTASSFAGAATGVTGQLTTLTQGAAVGTSTVIGSMKDVSIDITQADIDTTSLDSGGWEEFISGVKGWSVSNSGFMVSGDAGQDALEAAMIAAASVDVEFYKDKQGLTGAKGYKGTAVITKWNIKASTGSAVELSVDMKGNGPLVSTVKP